MEKAAEGYQEGFWKWALLVDRTVFKTQALNVNRKLTILIFLWVLDKIIMLIFLLII